MAHLNRMWTGMLTRNSANSGTNSPIVLIVNEGGMRDNLHHTFGDTPQDDQEKGEANLYELDISTKSIEPENLENSSIRIGTRGADLWRPEHIFVWGERLSNGDIIPLAIETEITTNLSAELNEGNISFPLRRVASGGARMNINRLLMLMTTKDVKHAGTNSSIELQVSVNGAVIVDFTVPDTPQDEQERGQANLYFVPVAQNFVKSDLDNSSITLSIKGQDMWKPESFFLFGLNNSKDRPERLVPLVHLDSWPHGAMSTDPNEGISSTPLTLV